MLNLVGYDLRAAIRRRASAIASLSRTQALFFWLTAAVVALGIALRARGFLFDQYGLWMDESGWATRLVKWPLVNLLIRPPGFMALGKGLVFLFSASERVLRSQAWVAGVGVVLLSLPLSRRLFQSPAARLLFVAVLALHPGAIDLSKEFKPYSISLFAHLGLLFLVLRYVETQRARDLAFVLVAATVSNLWGQDLVVAYPGLFLVLGWDTLQRRRARLGWVIGAAAAIVAILAVQYVLIWSKIKKGESIYWGDKYGVFYTHTAHSSYLNWWLHHHIEIAQLPGYRRRWWAPAWLSDDAISALTHVDEAIWLVVTCVGLLALFIQRRWRLALLLLMPFAAVTAVNLLGHWPEGVFRTNLFYVGYTAAIAAMAFEAPGGGVITWSAVVPAVVLVVAPLLIFDRTWDARKNAFCKDTDFPRAFKKLAELGGRTRHGEKVPVLVSHISCRGFDYYSKLNPATAKYSRVIDRKYDYTCARGNGALPKLLTDAVKHGHSAVLLTEFKDDDLERLQQQLPRVSFAPVPFDAPLESNPRIVLLGQAE